MKKGFSNFSSINLNSQNSQPNQQPSENNNQKSNPLHNLTDKPNTNQRKQPPTTGFITIKKQPSNMLVQNDNHLNRSTYPKQQFPASSVLPNGIGNNGLQNGAFGNFPMMNMESASFYQNSMGSFNDNPYAMLFNQFQNNPSLSGNQASSQAMIMTLFQIIQNQAKSLQNLYGKVQKMTQKINQFGLKMKQMKKLKKQAPAEEQEMKPVIQHIGQSMQNIDSKTLIKILFGSNRAYNYSLQLNEPLELPLYRQRNFSISLKLIDLQGKLVKNNNKIPLSLAIYSSQNPPKFIEKNTAGQKILKGYIQQSLHHGQCRFQKIQIKQVTSHFRNGWVFMVIIPCMTPLGSANPNDNFIDYLKIQPLVLEKVVVKAKKIKDANKKGKEEKQESQMIEAKDSEFGQSQKIQSKQKNQNSGGNKPKPESNFQHSEDIFEDK